MNSQDNLGFFFGNLVRLIQEAGISKRQLSLMIGRQQNYISNLLAQRSSPGLDAVYAIAEALKIDVADLLRPGPQFSVAAESGENYWIEKTAERVLAAALERSRERTAYEAPTFDSVLNWWHANNGVLTGLGVFEQYIEIFEPPKDDEMRPIPKKVGSQSLAARELGITEPAHLERIFASSDPEVARSVAIAHQEVSHGQPQLSVHTITVNMSNGNAVKLSYNRLLLPVIDGNGQRFILNYSKPVRRSEIGREHFGEFDTIHGGKPVLSGMV